MDDTDLYADAVVAGLGSFDASGTVDALKTNPFTADKYAHDATFIKAVKSAVHYDLYVIANSNYVNTMSTSSYVEERLVSWRVGYISALSVTGALCLASIAAYLILALKARKEAN